MTDRPTGQVNEMSNEERLQKIEKQLLRIERMLQQLVAKP